MAPRNERAATSRRGPPLDQSELDEQQAIELPKREALSLMVPGVGLLLPRALAEAAPVDAAVEPAPPSETT